MAPKAIIAGSTGLIGSELENLLLNDNYYSEVISLTRRSINKTHKNFKNLVVDFDKLQDYTTDLRGQDVYCCLGTTMKKAGSKEKFKKVDYQYPVELAKIAKSNGATGFFLVSSMGADPSSGIFYNQVKGEVEREISKLDFNTFHIVRPALLLGNRDESRPGEYVAQLIFKALDFIMVGPLKKYKAIDYKKVARAMQRLAIEAKPGKHIHESKELQNY